MKPVGMFDPVMLEKLYHGDEFEPFPMLIPLVVHADDRGSLFEVLHDYELPGYIEKRFGQVYMVKSPVRGTIRGFHRHDLLWDYFCVVHGRAKVVMVRPKANEPSVADEVWSTVLAAEKPSVVVIPPLVFHGWEALTDDTILLSIGSEVYNPKTPDEERIPFDTFGDVWGIKPK